MGLHFYVMRDDDNRVVSISSNPQEGHDEVLPAGHPEVVRLVVGDSASAEGTSSQVNLMHTDHKMVRIIEDLIDILVKKEVINYTDLPEVVTNKLSHRRQMRQGDNTLQILDEDDII
ncbi:MAG: hypothetical protein HQL53_01830 [Magnetococcales bacterium]|nr:hypothetical protein [Magnetococcales bacterium]